MARLGVDEPTHEGGIRKRAAPRKWSSPLFFVTQVSWIYGRGVQPISTGMPAGMPFGSASIFADPGIRVFAALPAGTGPESPTRLTPTPEGVYGRLLPSSSVGFAGAGGDGGADLLVAGSFPDGNGVPDSSSVGGIGAFSKSDGSDGA